MVFGFLFWSIRFSKAGHGRALGVLSIWIIWDRLLEWWWHTREVQPNGFLRYRLTHHHGAAITLRDGTVINRGDALVELHFDNRRLLQRPDTPGWSPLQSLRLVAADLGRFNRLIEAGELSLVRALRGTTLYAGAGPRLGFEVRPVPHTWTWAVERFYLIGLLPIYHPDGWREVDRMRRDRWPGQLWMSRAALARRYAA